MAEENVFETPEYPTCPHCGSENVVRTPGSIDRPPGILYFRCRDCAELWTLRLKERRELRQQHRGGADLYRDGARAARIVRTTDVAGA